MEEFNPESLEGVVEIGTDLYVKRPENFRPLESYLNEQGYSLKPSEDREHKPIEGQWFGKVELERKGRCSSCKQLIEVQGIRSHDNKCEKCGKPTYLAFQDGSYMCFSLSDDSTSDHLVLVIHDYNEQKKQIAFFANPKDCKNPIKLGYNYRNKQLEESYKKLEEKIANFPETLRRGEINETPVVIANYEAASPFVQEHSLNTIETAGDVYNHEILRLFRGKEFPEYTELPVPETLMIYEAWHWAPLEPGQDLYKKIMSAARQVSRKDYYHQDGRPAFCQNQIDWMLKFIEHFTTIPINNVRPYIHTRLSGPGLIDRLAKLTGQSGVIITEPNMFNTIEFIASVQEGKFVSRDEFDAAVSGYFLDENGKLIDKVAGSEETKEIFKKAEKIFYPKNKKSDSNR